MKARLNLTIDEGLLKRVKNYAASKKSSVSELVENYFKTFAQVSTNKSIIDIVEELPKPKMTATGDLKKKYTEDNASKYGF
ncbi:DUF6364 family protein [Olivibacter sitiensis]|uniref:DUF6364 family protein n=1 Tax=Olivibacter sitiensis TaxID=376470 RepID=UPI0004240699|nr:DUF6364 family protein [Olivibacter sitiensis]